MPRSWNLVAALVIALVLLVVALSGSAVILIWLGRPHGLWPGLLLGVVAVVFSVGVIAASIFRVVRGSSRKDVRAKSRRAETAG